MADGGVELIDRAAAAARLPEFRALLEIALTAQTRARATYSGFRVGAAVLGGSGSVFPGCNVESASYGATICAERSAVVGAVAAGETSIRACVVVTPTADPSSPCGICRQLLREFGGDLLVFAASSASDAVYVATLADLLPLSFGPGNLAEAGGAGGTTGAAEFTTRGAADRAAGR
jgi:cytidine deaminase